MYLKNPKDVQGIFEGYGYRVVLNPVAPVISINTKKKSKAARDEAIKLADGSQGEPNYLVVNLQTGAVEFASDQLPTAVEVTKKLAEHMKSLMEPEKPRDDEKVTPIRGH